MINPSEVSEILKKELSAVFFNGNHYGYFILMAVLIGLGYYLFSSNRSKATLAGLAKPLNPFSIHRDSTGSLMWVLSPV